MSKRNHVLSLIGICICICSICIACSVIEEDEKISNSAYEGKENLSWEYEIETDDQSCYDSDRIILNEYGYYYFKQDIKTAGNILMFWDKSSKIETPLCNNPDCKHNGEQCNAYFSQGGYQKESYFGYKLWYYDHAIYHLGCDEEDNVNIYRVAEDGSSREVAACLYKVDSTVIEEDGASITMTWPGVCIHRGFIYYVNYDETILKIRKVDLETLEEKVIYEHNMGRGDLYRLKGYGDYIFFEGGYFVDDDYTQYKGDLMFYNTKTGQIQTVVEAVTGPYAVYADNIFYSDDSSIRKFDLITEEDSLLIQNDEAYVNFSIDENGLYVFEDELSCLNVYSLDGKLMKTIETDKNLIFLGGDQDYLLAREDERIVYISKQNILADGTDWNTISE